MASATARPGRIAAHWRRIGAGLEPVPGLSSAVIAEPRDCAIRQPTAREEFLIQRGYDSASRAHEGEWQTTMHDACESSPQHPKADGNGGRKMLEIGLANGFRVLAKRVAHRPTPLLSSRR